ncbi:MAG: ATP-dependent sacrificial sulfur transferase LarE [Deltaproteobacteria bacterium]|nr:ATP-dependent sacrificial sulfur transferase LarE [Deltaproteobacteria bacterium]
MNDIDRLLNHDYANLKEILEKMGRVAIAYSGGTDSTLLLRIAADVLKDSVIALTARSETTPQGEYTDAVTFTRQIGVRHIIVETHEMRIPEFVQNLPDRCYICKKIRYETIMTIARQHGFTVIADGENADDGKDYRPGSIAARELGVRSPLNEAGLTKDRVRALSRKLGLPTWNKPALACLASRIPYHSPITPEKLRQIDEAETFIRSWGNIGQVRVRHFGDTAHIEMDLAGMTQLMEPSVREQTVSFFRRLGFVHIFLDLGGYQMGNLNPIR